MAERPITYDHLRSRKKAITQKVRIALDSDLAEEYEEAKSKLETARNRVGVRPDNLDFQVALEDALAEVDTLKSRLREESIEFVFKSIGRRKFDDLITAHPPTTEQRRKHKDDGAGELNWNVDTFPPALIFASLVEPTMEEQEVKELWDSDEWSGAETMSLFLTAMEVNSNRKVVDLGKD